MKTQSGLFGSLSRALTGSLPEGGDDNLSFPQVILCALPPLFTHDPVTNQAAGTSTPLDRTTSFHQTFGDSIAAAAGAKATTLFYLQSGVWEITFCIDTQIPAAVSNLTIDGNQMTYPGLSGIQTMNVYKAFGTGAQQAASVTRRIGRIAIPKGQTVRFVVNFDNTAGASAMSMALFCNCEKLV